VIKHRLKRRGVDDALIEVAEAKLPRVYSGQESKLQHRDLLRAFAALPAEQRSVLFLIGVETFPARRLHRCWAFRSEQ
jgi:DNA-directed RNA polymerase specialized sigma24 family protein